MFALGTTIHSLFAATPSTMYTNQGRDERPPLLSNDLATAAPPATQTVVLITNNLVTICKREVELSSICRDTPASEVPVAVRQVNIDLLRSPQPATPDTSRVLTTGSQSFAQPPSHLRASYHIRPSANAARTSDKAQDPVGLSGEEEGGVFILVIHIRFLHPSPYDESFVNSTVHISIPPIQRIPQWVRTVVVRAVPASDLKLHNAISSSPLPVQFKPGNMLLDASRVSGVRIPTGPESWAIPIPSILSRHTNRIFEEPLCFYFVTGPRIRMFHSSCKFSARFESKVASFHVMPPRDKSAGNGLCSTLFRRAFIFARRRS